MCAPEPNWTIVLSALLTPTVAILGIYIAFRQWKTSRGQAQTEEERLRHDLFDRRFEVYDSARTLIGNIMTSGQITHEDTMAFLTGTREAKWLLDENIAEYFDKQIWHKAVHLETLQSELESLGQGEERSANIKKQREIKNWYQVQYSVLDEKMSRYLRLQN